MKPFFSRHYELSDCVYRDANHGTPSFVRLNTDVKRKQIKKKKKSKQKLADVRVHLRNILKVETSHVLIYSLSTSIVENADY